MEKYLVTETLVIRLKYFQVNVEVTCKNLQFFFPVNLETTPLTSLCEFTGKTLETFRTHRLWSL